MFQIRTDCLCSICRLYSKVYNEHKLDIATKNSIKARKSDDTSLRIYKFITTELAFMVQTYDGASTMSGQISGVQTCIREVYPQCDTGAKHC